MKYFNIKVCGITREKDAFVASQLGVDMLGFIFYKKSPRYISPYRAKNIIKQIPATVLTVGIFVDEDINKLSKIAHTLALDFVQLHGHETSKKIVQLQKAGLKVIKALPLQSKPDIEKIVKCKADLVLVDNMTKNFPGGTGNKFNWDIKLPKLSNLVLSGGLNIDNVAEGVKKYKPLVVDVNSGVEIKPGLKSEKKLKAFLAECNNLRYE